MISALERLPDAALYGLAFGLSVLLVALLTPLAGRIATRYGIVDRPGGHRVHERATPTLGGLAVAAGLVCVALIIPGVGGQVATILVCALAIALLGLLDDTRRVGPFPRLAVEAGAGIALWIAGIRAGLFGVPVLDLGLTVFWVLAITNAVNLIDNMDGVAGGVTAVAALAYFAVASGDGSRLVAALALATAGAAAGFLWHNFPPAKIFLGDSGALLFGFLLAALGLQLDLVGETGAIRVAIPILILAVPVFDTILVVTARFLGGRPVYVGGADHTSHRLVARGLSVRSVAIAFYVVQATCAAAAVLLLEARRGVVLVVAGLAATSALVALGVLLRTEPTQTRAVETVHVE